MATIGSTPRGLTVLAPILLDRFTAAAAVGAALAIAAWLASYALL